MPGPDPCQTPWRRRTNVAVVVDSDATHVHAHAVALVRPRPKRLLLPRQGVVQVQLAPSGRGRGSRGCCQPCDVPPPCMPPAADRPRLCCCCCGCCCVWRGHKQKRRQQMGSELQWRQAAAAGGGATSLSQERGAMPLTCCRIVDRPKDATPLVPLAASRRARQALTAGCRLLPSWAPLSCIAVPSMRLWRQADLRRRGEAGR